MTITTRRSSRLGEARGGGGPSSLSSPKKTTIVSSSVVVDENAPNLLGARRRLTRKQTAAAAAAAAMNEDEEENELMDQEAEDDDNDDEDEDADEESYVFNGVTYATYQEMVDAKRLRNQQVLAASGLLKAAAIPRPSSSSSSFSASASNKKKRRSSTSTSTASSNNTRRTSKRLAGIESDGTFVDDERGGRFSIASGESSAAAATSITTTDMNMNNNDRRGPRRINDGSDLSLEQAVQLVAPYKWLEENSVAQAQSLVRDTILPPQPQKRLASVSSSSTNKSNSSSSSGIIESSSSRFFADRGNATKGQQQDGSNNSGCSWTRKMQEQLQDRSSIDYNCTIVTKVVPDRIYSITTHPSSHQLLVCAGDKQGHVGIWNVDAGASLSSSSSQAAASTSAETDSSGKSNKDSPVTTVSALEASKRNDNKSSSSSSNKNRDGIHLFRPHASTTACLEWTRQGTALLSMSYDGTCRLFDVATERFQQVFDSSSFSSSGSHGGVSEEVDCFYESDYWFQYACLDHRNQDCFFLSTSVGTAMHVDMRASGKQRVTFHEEWSEKKINSLSLHPNGNHLLSAGLDTKARLWDLRVLSSHDSLGRNSGRKESGVKGHVQPMIQPVAYYEAGRSINSAFFSPSGKFVVSTTQMDRLDILQDIHLAAATFTTKNKVAVPIRVEPVQSIRHDNKTGRWLSTVMASWHAVHDVFCVGSMEQPRVMEVFSLDLLNNNKSSGDQFGRVAIGGDAMTAVTSRCCFHSRGDHLIVVGGTSSGRVALSR